MKELDILQVEEIQGGVDKVAVCGALGFILGLSLSTANPLAAMGAVVGGYLNGCF